MKTISVSPQKYTGVSFDADSVFFNPIYIPLETIEACLINKIGKVLWHDHKFYILDRIGAKVLIFNEDGSFVSAIGKHGKGPREFRSADDIAICNKTLYLLASHSKN